MIPSLSRPGETRGRARIVVVGLLALAAIWATGCETPETLHTRCVQTCAPAPLAAVVYRGRWMCACYWALAVRASAPGGRS